MPTPESVISDWIYDDACKPHPGSDNEKAESIIEELIKAGFVIVPKPTSAGKANDGFLFLGYKDTEANRDVVANVAAIMFELP